MILDSFDGTRLSALNLSESPETFESWLSWETISIVLANFATNDRKMKIDFDPTREIIYINVAQANVLP